MRGSISQTVKRLGGGLAALGVRVDKPATAKPVSAATSDLFVIRGGKILLTSLIGEVTIDITDVGPDLAYLQHAYTTGTPGTTDLCDSATGLDIGGDTVGTIYIITGDITVDLEDDADVGVYIASMGTNLLVLQPGTIQLVCSATETGSIKWLLHYIAIDKNAYVLPA